jgi:hypothetical protein
MPQLAPSQVAAPFATAGQGAHAAPQVLTEALLTHAPPHRWKPGLQATPQLVPSQVATPFVGAGHAVHEPPQVAGAELLAHAPPHVW